MKPLLKQMILAARLDGKTYESVEANPSSNVGAVLIIIAASLAAALGSGVYGFAGIGALTIIALMTWMVWVVLTFVIGTTLLATPDTHTSLGEILRTTGFSAAPGILRVFGIVPVIGSFIFAGATVWMLFTFVVAVRHALDFTSSWRALAVCLLGWLIHGIVLFGLVRTAI
jgi:hypothetical protein